MDINVSARNVLKRVYAGKEEPTPETEKIDVANNNTPKTISYLFFNAGEEIPFNDVSGYVKENKDKAIVNLENGNFSWDKAILKTNEYNAGEPEPEENSLIYVVKLNRDGTLAGNEVLKDMKNNDRTNANLKNYDVILNKIRSMIFADNKLNFSLNPQLIKRSYADRDLVEIIKSGAVRDAIRINDFDNYYGIGTHRMRTMPTTNIPGAAQEPVLLGARYEIPSAADNFARKNKPFLGSKDQMEYLKKLEGTKAVQDIKTEDPEKQTEGEVPMKEEQKTNFEPVSEQEKTTEREVKDKYKKAKEEKDSRIVELKKDDPDANYYTGDNSVMQDLVRRQHKRMKIRKTAALEPGEIPDPVTDKGINDTKKYLDEKQKMVKKVNDLHKQIQQTTHQTSSPFGNKSAPGAMTASSSTVKKVLSKFLKK